MSIPEKRSKSSDLSPRRIPETIPLPKISNPRTPGEKAIVEWSKELATWWDHVRQSLTEQD